MRIGILGPLEVSDGTRGLEVGGARLRALLTLLALQPGRVVPTERLIDDLWEADPPNGAPNALQSLVSRLRAALGEQRARLESHPAGYRLAVPRSAVDAYDFEERLARARGLAEPALVADGLREALELWRGPALADAAGAPFAEATIVRLEGLRRAAVEERIDADLALGRHAELIPELEALTAADPLREPLRGRLMKALYGAGRQADALTVYADTRRALADGLGVDPSPALEEIYLAVLRRDPALEPPAAPALPPPAVALTNLRASLTSFIGRDLDVARVGKRLRDVRLVTLLGPGGAGKTRLAQEAGGRLLEEMPDGVWMVRLAPLADPAEVPHAVLSALGLRDFAVSVTQRGGKPADLVDPLDRLTAALAAKRTLLIVDNCEHVVDAAASVVDRVLADCPGVRVLATSREPLGITGETLWPVEPLGLPPADASAAESLGFPAVRLLADRAAAVRPGFEVTGDNVADVVAICTALDGMPLAIELAAARMRALTPAVIAARLDDRFRLLTGGSRTALPRHQTLRAVVEWSWDLLDGHERTMLRRLAVFAGGATVDAVEAVCGGDLEVLADLVDKSLVVPTSTGRYRLLETIRAYALERLAEAGEEPRVRRVHAEFFTGLARSAEPELRGMEQLAALDLLAADHDNLHSALRWATAVGDGELAVRLCAPLGFYWWLGGHRTEGGEVAVTVLDLPDLPETQDTALSFAMTAAGAFGGPRDIEQTMGWMRRGRAIAAALPAGELHPFLRLIGPLIDLFHEPDPRAPMEETAALFDAPDAWLRGMARFMYGQALINLGRPDGAWGEFERALAEFEPIGERWGMSSTYMALAEGAAWRGDFPATVRLLERALALLTQLNTADDLPHLHTRLAMALWHTGERERATAVMAEAARTAARSGNPECVAPVLFQFGEMARLDGRLEEAVAKLDAADANLAAQGPPQFRGMIAASRGAVDLASGDARAARERFHAALSLGTSARDYPIIALAVGFLACLALHEGDPAAAAELLGTAETLRGAPDLSQPDAARAAETCRALLGAEAYTAARTRGAAVTLQDLFTRLSLDMPEPFRLF